MSFGENTSHTWHVTLSRCFTYRCKHANIMSLYDFWEIIYLIEKDRYFIWGKIIHHENEQGNKKTQICKMWLKFVDIWPKKKRKKDWSLHAIDPQTWMQPTKRNKEIEEKEINVTKMCNKKHKVQKKRKKIKTFIQLT